MRTKIADAFEGLGFQVGVPCGAWVSRFVHAELQVEKPCTLCMLEAVTWRLARGAGTECPALSLVDSVAGGFNVIMPVATACRVESGSHGR